MALTAWGHFWFLEVAFLCNTHTGVAGFAYRLDQCAPFNGGQPVNSVLRNTTFLVPRPPRSFGITGCAGTKWRARLSSDTLAAPVGGFVTDRGAATTGSGAFMEDGSFGSY